jgi:hypothetical protein
VLLACHELNTCGEELPMRTQASVMLFAACNTKRRLHKVGQHASLQAAVVAYLKGARLGTLLVEVFKDRSPHSKSRLVVCSGQYMSAVAGQGVP